jgi:hypothetical protein
MKLLSADGLSTCALRLKRGGDRRRTGTAIRGTEGARIAGPLRRNIHEVMHVCVLRRRCEVLGLAHRCHALVRSCFDVPLHGLWHFRLGRSGRTVSPWLLSFCPLPSSCCVGRSPSLKGGLVFSSTPQAPNGRGKRRATGHRPTRDKKRGLWPVRFSAGLGGVRRPGTGHTGPLPGRPADPARLRCPARVPSPASHPAPPQLLGTMPTLATRRAGHLTLALTCCRKRERRRSGRWRQAAARLCSARSRQVEPSPFLCPLPTHTARSHGPFALR